MQKITETVKKQIDELFAEKDIVIVAIDGKCTSGKTTLASKLAEIYDCNVFHMDDFFLRPEQRTPERFAEIGGNVDYERFREEVLLPLKSGKAFSYRPFDCCIRRSPTAAGAVLNGRSAELRRPVRTCSILS